MSISNILDVEIQRRKDANKQLLEGEVDINATIEQFNKLDELHRSNEKTSREKLEGIYRESRHFTGKQPLVYSFAQTEKYPLFGGPADTDCNPYFPITKVQNKTFDGITPYYAPPTRTGAWQRDTNYSATEDVPRGPAATALLAFPDISGEPLPGGWPGPPLDAPGFCTGETPPGSGTTEALCLANGGVWTPPSPIADPVWVGSATAPALLRVPLQAWRDDVAAILADIWNDTAEVNYWQNLLDDMDLVLAAVANDAVFVRATGNPDPAAWGQTQDFTNGSPEDLARDRLITAAQTGVLNHVNARKAKLNTDANSEEQLFFGIIKLRLHLANGSYTKLQTAKSQKVINKSIMDDNIAAIRSLNLLKVKNS